MRLFDAEVLENSPLAEGMIKLVLKAEKAFEGEVAPGQFAHVLVPNASAHLLRRPISIMNADSQNKTITLGIAPKGEGTKLIAAVKVGDTLNVLAPLGTSFTLKAKAEKTVWAFGGGVGVAPMLYTVREFSKFTKITSFMGFRSKGNIFAREEFSACSTLITCTDDGSEGFCGNVVMAAREEKTLPDLIVACGPTPMLKAVKAFAEEHSIPCQISLEQHMGCGYGACLTCSCKGKKEDGSETYKRVCADGPVFNSKEVIL